MSTTTGQVQLLTEIVAVSRITPYLLYSTLYLLPAILFECLNCEGGNLCSL